MSGAWDFTPAKNDSPSLRTLRCRAKLRELLCGGADMLFYEKVHRHMGTQAAHVYGALLTVLQEECDAAGVPYMGLGVGTWKKVFTGKGNASKGEVLRCCHARGHQPGSEDEADAIGIATAGIEAELPKLVPARSLPVACEHALSAAA